MSDPAGGPADISITARYTAAAWEKLGLPHAGRFTDRTGRAVLAAISLRDRLIPWGFRPVEDILAPRHLYLNDRLRQGGERQVVEIAAGFSPRGLTLSGEGVRYIEVDRLNVIEEKQRLCGKLGERMHFVAADALAPDFAERVLASCDTTLGTALLSEGLSPYFDRDSYLKVLRNFLAVAKPLSAPLLTDIYMAPSRRSFINAELNLSQVVMKAVADRFHLYLRDAYEIRALFSEAGWNVVNIAQPAAEARYRKTKRKLRWDPVRIVEARPAS